MQTIPRIEVCPGVRGVDCRGTVRVFGGRLSREPPTLPDTPTRMSPPGRSPRCWRRCGCAQGLFDPSEIRETGNAPTADDLGCSERPLLSYPSNLTRKAAAHFNPVVHGQFSADERKHAPQSGRRSGS